MTDETGIVCEFCGRSDVPMVELPDDGSGVTRWACRDGEDCIEGCN